MSILDLVLLLMSEFQLKQPLAAIGTAASKSRGIATTAQTVLDRLLLITPSLPMKFSLLLSVPENLPNDASDATDGDG